MLQSRRELDGGQWHILYMTSIFAVKQEVLTRWRMRSFHNLDCQGFTLSLMFRTSSVCPRNEGQTPEGGSSPLSVLSLIYYGVIVTPYIKGSAGERQKQSQSSENKKPSVPRFKLGYSGAPSDEAMRVFVVSTAWKFCLITE